MKTQKPKTDGTAKCQDAVKRYILEQQGKDVFEHSVYENKNQKIGDFTNGNRKR